MSRALEAGRAEFAAIMALGPRLVEDAYQAGVNAFLAALGVGERVQLAIDGARIAAVVVRRSSTRVYVALETTGRELAVSVSEGPRYGQVVGNPNDLLWGAELEPVGGRETFGRAA